MGKYLKDDGSEHQEFTKTVMDDFPDEPAYRKCRSTLNSSAKLESLVWKEVLCRLTKENNTLPFARLYLFILLFQASSAKWEPPHGRFIHIFYPWSEYVKVGAVLRYCTYEVMALHGVLHSEIQVCVLIRYSFMY